MKWVSISVSAGIALLGLWILGLAFFQGHQPVTPAPIDPAASIEVVGQTPGAQLAIGFALLAGGIFAIYLASRR